MKISKERLRQIINEEIENMTKSEASSAIDEVYDTIRSFLNEAKQKNSDLIKNDKFKILEKTIGMKK